MKLDQEAKKAVDVAQKGYNKAEKEVDGFFAKDGHTVLILTGAAVVIVGLVIALIYCAATHG